jgi:hypothetical protein
VQNKIGNERYYRKQLELATSDEERERWADALANFLEMERRAKDQTKLRSRAKKKQRKVPQQSNRRVSPLSAIAAALLAMKESEGYEKLVGNDVAQTVWSGTGAVAATGGVVAVADSYSELKASGLPADVLSVVEFAASHHWTFGEAIVIAGVGGIVATFVAIYKLTKE